MINMFVNIRNARISDLASVKEILKIKELGWTEEHSFNYLKRLINTERGIFLVAEYASKIIGLIYGEFNEEEDWAELFGVGVSEEYRRQGISYQLIKEFEKIVKNKNISTIELFAHIDTLSKYIHKLGYKKGETYINCWKKLK